MQTETLLDAMKAFRFDPCSKCGGERQPIDSKYADGSPWVAPFCPTCDEPRRNGDDMRE